MPMFVVQFEKKNGINSTQITVLHIEFRTKPFVQFSHYYRRTDKAKVISAFICNFPLRRHEKVVEKSVPKQGKGKHE
jgi:hypothetical protein